MKFISNYQGKFFIIRGSVPHCLQLIRIFNIFVIGTEMTVTIKHKSMRKRFKKLTLLKKYHEFFSSSSWVTSYRSSRASLFLAMYYFYYKYNRCKAIQHMYNAIDVASKLEEHDSVPKISFIRDLMKMERIVGNFEEYDRLKRMQQDLITSVKDLKCHQCVIEDHIHLKINALIVRRRKQVVFSEEQNWQQKTVKAQIEVLRNHISMTKDRNHAIFDG